VLLLTALARPAVRGWSWLAVELMVSAAGSFCLYLLYSVGVTIAQAVSPRLAPWVLTRSLLIVVGKACAMGLVLSYLFEILDVLGRRKPAAVELPEAPPGWD